MNGNLASVDSAGNSNEDATSKPPVNDEPSLNLQVDSTVGVSATSKENGAESVSGDGNKVLKMNKAMDRTIEHCLSMLNYSSLKKHLLPHRDENKKMEKMLRSLQKEMVEKIRANIKDEIKLMMDEENIAQMLINFESFLASATSIDPSWRPTGDPEKDVAAHLIDPLSTTLAKLDSTIAEEEAENDRLCRAVLERRRVIENLKSKACENQKQLVENAIDLEDWVEKFEALC